MSLRIHPAPLIIDDPWQRVERFFTLDESRKYDAYIASGVSPLNRIVDDDVTAINTSMRARSPHSDWSRVIRRRELAELAAIDRDADLFGMEQERWQRLHLPERLLALFGAVLGPGIGISRATKVLHIKRPALIPVCDAYVLRLLGIPGEGAEAGVAAVVHLREEGRRIRETLAELQRRLCDELGISRTLVRILDVLIWGSYPDTWLAREGGGSPPVAPAGG